MQNIKWRETLSLLFLNISVVISWIAYHEYQPKLLKEFKIDNLYSVTVIAKAIILVFIPPLAGYLADKIMAKSNGSFLIFTIGISLTAITFMSVATIIGAGPLSAISGLLPIMVVIWLIAMNLFNSPAVSLIEKFAPESKLPIIAAVLFGVTELVYAIEPVVVELVRFFGDLLTFVVGFILISVSGFLFRKVSRDEIDDRISNVKSISIRSVKFKNILVILIIGIIGGFANAILVEYLPGAVESNTLGINAGFVSLILLAISAILSIPMSLAMVKRDIKKFLIPGLIVILIAGSATLAIQSPDLKILFAMILALSFALVSVTGLPYIIKNINKKWLTLAVGLYFGASEIFSGIFEVNEIF
jgi:MFS family permease